MVPPNFSIFPYWVLGLDVPLRIWVQIKPCTAQWRAMTGKQASDFSGLFRSVHSIPQIIASQGLILSTLPAQLKDFKSMPYIAQLPSHGKLLLATVAQIYQARRINKPGCSPAVEGLPAEHWNPHYMWGWGAPPPRTPGPHQWSGRFLGITGRDPSVCKSNRLHCSHPPVFLYKNGVCSINSSRMIGKFPAVLNFNRLFLRLDRFICN